jgi:hypothetical protein
MFSRVTSQNAATLTPTSPKSQVSGLITNSGRPRSRPLPARSITMCSSSEGSSGSPSSRFSPSETMVTVPLTVLSRVGVKRTVTSTGSTSSAWGGTRRGNSRLPLRAKAGSPSTLIASTVSGMGESLKMRNLKNRPLVISTSPNA